MLFEGATLSGLIKAGTYMGPPDTYLSESGSTELHVDIHAGSREIEFPGIIHQYSLIN